MIVSVQFTDKGGELKAIKDKEATLYYVAVSNEIMTQKKKSKEVS